MVPSKTADGSSVWTGQRAVFFQQTGMLEDDILKFLLEDSAWTNEILELLRGSPKKKLCMPEHEKSNKFEFIVSLHAAEPDHEPAATLNGQTAVLGKMPLLSLLAFSEVLKATWSSQLDQLGVLCEVAASGCETKN